MTERLLLRPEEAAEVLGIGRSKLYVLLAEGAIESVHIGTCRRIPLEALHGYVDRLRAGRPTHPTMSIKTHTTNRGTVYEVRLRGPDGREVSRRFRTKADAANYEAA